MKLSFVKIFLFGALGFVAAAPISAQELVEPPAMAPGAGLIQTLTPPQFARLSPGGSFLGNVSRAGRDGGLRSIPNLDVSLVTAGRIVSRVRTNPDGDFAFAQIRPGYYTVVASNPTELLVLPLTIAPSDGQDVEPTLMVAASSVPPSRRQAMLGATLNVPGGFLPFAPLPLPQQRDTVGTYNVEVNAAGELRGRLAALGTPYSQIDMTGMVVRLMREDTVMGEAAVSPEGSFVIPGVNPGHASFFAFGPQGFVAIGIKLVGADAGFSATPRNNPETYVSMQGGAANFNIEIAPTPDVVAGASVPGDSFSGPSAPIGPAGAGGVGGPGAGGGFGGGGGGGGGLGAEGLMGLGAAALAAAALTGDDGDNFTPAPASPSQVP